MKEVKVRAQKRTYTSLMYLRTKSRLDAGADQTSCRGGWVSGIKVLLLRVCIGGMGCGVVPSVHMHVQKVEVSVKVKVSVVVTV